jgi:hypothetical protein
MEDEKSTAELVNAMTNESLAHEMLHLERRVQRTPNLFVMGYCASDPQTFERVSEYLQGRVAPQLQAPLEVNLVPRFQRNLRPYVREHIGDIQASGGGIAVIKARGFESLKFLNPEYCISERLAHDYDQDVIQSQEQFEAIGLTNKTLIITHIDSTKDKNAYELAVRSACNSQFKSFLYEFE